MLLLQDKLVGFCLEHLLRRYPQSPRRRSRRTRSGCPVRRVLCPLVDI